MKPITSGIVAVACLVSLTACGAGSSNPAATPAATVTVTATPKLEPVVPPPTVDSTLTDRAQFLTALHQRSQFTSYKDPSLFRVATSVCDRFSTSYDGVREVELGVQKVNTTWTRSMTHFFVATAGNYLCSEAYAIAPD